MTGSRFGQGLGLFGGPMINISGGRSYQFCDFANLACTGTLVFQNLYCENQVRIGHMAGNAATNAPVLFIGCHFDCSENLHGQIPAALLQTGVSHSVTFDSCAIRANFRITNLTGTGVAAVMCNGTQLIGGYGMGGAKGTPAKQQAVNWCGGLLLGGSRINTNLADYSRFANGNYGTYFAAPTGDIGTQAMNNIIAMDKPRAPINQATRGFADYLGRTWQASVAPQGLIYPGMMTTLPAFNGDILTFTLSMAAYTYYGGCNVAPGDLLYHHNTDTIFVVTAIGAADAGGNIPVTAQQQNNMQTDGAGNFVSNNCPDLTLANYTSIIKTGGSVSQMVMWGTFTAGSTTVTNVHNGNGYGGNVDTYLAAGDPLFGNANPDAGAPWPTSERMAIQSVTNNASGGTVVLTKPALCSGRFPISSLPIH